MQMNKNYRKLLDLYYEFNDFLFQVHGFYLDSIAGFHSLLKHIGEAQKQLQSLSSEANQVSVNEVLESIGFSHSALVGKEYAASGVHFAKTGNVRKRNERNGKNQQFLGAMCLVILYSYWETIFRNKLSEALGLKSKDLLFPIWGDIKTLRHCILHKSRLDKGDIKKIEVLTWFCEGDEVIIDQGKFRNLMVAMLTFGNWIHEQSLPKKGISIPTQS